VEVAFLHGDLDEEIYMNCPPSLEHKPDECVLRLKALYSLVQAAYQFFQKFTDIIKSIGFIQKFSEPCMLFKPGDANLTVAVIHVDDYCLVGSDESLDKLMKYLEFRGLNLRPRNTLLALGVQELHQTGEIFVRPKFFCTSPTNMLPLFQ
jgi:Reverse transcriptase (RNA-dependent DNA polymerase)